MNKFVMSVLALLALALGAQAQLSVETLGVIRYQDLKGPATYGVGVDAGYAFNKFVSGHARLVTYEPWAETGKGSAVDEGSLYVQAKLLQSANGKASLSGTGGAHYDQNRGDFGFGVGTRADLTVYKKLSLFAAGELRAWFNQPKDALVTRGLSLKF